MARVTAAVAVLRATEAHKHFPKFSWDTLPVTWHGSTDTVFSDDDVQALGKYASVTLEKNVGKDDFPYSKGSIDTCQQGTDTSACGCCAEDHFVENFKKLKAAFPDVQTSAYTNSIIAYPWYRAAQKDFLANETFWLRNKDGELQHNIKQSSQTWYTWNFAIPEVVDIFKKQCLSMVQTGVVDGCYADGCENVPGPLDSETQTAYVANKRAMLADLQDEVPGIILCGSGGGTMKGVLGSSVQNWGKHGEYSKREIPMLQKAVADGVMFEAKGNAVCSKGGDPNDADIQTELAAFLIAAGEYSYYRCGGWGHTDVPWYPVYDKKLGAPLGDATLKNGVWTRAFASGTKVTYDTTAEKGSISWADEAMQV